MIRTYSDLCKLVSFEERYLYLKLNGSTGEETFGFDRFINQKFYKSPEWKAVRDFVIIRDNGCDLGLIDIRGKIIVHHMNPISKNDIAERSDLLLNPEFLISTSHATHNAIHYSDEKLLMSNLVVERLPNDTCPWKK